MYTERLLIHYFNDKSTILITKLATRNTEKHIRISTGSVTLEGNTTTYTIRNMVHISDPYAPNAVTIVGGDSNAVSKTLHSESGGVVDLNDCMVCSRVNISEFGRCSDA